MVCCLFWFGFYDWYSGVCVDCVGVGLLVVVAFIVVVLCLF